MTTQTTSSSSEKPIPDKVFFKIGDVAEIAGVKPYVLRYWETEFTVIAPQKTATGQRVYRRRDVETVLLIKKLLYGERYSIEGARKRIKELKKNGDIKEARVSAGAQLETKPLETRIASEMRAADSIAAHPPELLEAVAELREALVEDTETWFPV